MKAKLLTVATAAVISLGAAGLAAASPVTAFLPGPKTAETMIVPPLTQTKGDAIGPMYRPKTKTVPRQCSGLNNCYLGGGATWRKLKTGKRGIVDPHPTHPKTKTVPPLKRGIGGVNPPIYRP